MLLTISLMCMACGSTQETTALAEDADESLQDDGDENLQNMTEEMSKVKTGEVTYAVRDTQIDGKVIKENDIMGIGDAGISAVGQSIKGTTLDMLDDLIDENSELVSIYYGEGMSEEDAQELAEAVTASHAGIECEVNYGGQPVYYYIVSVE